MLRSDLVVISWWSNCLGLACLRALLRYTHDRQVYVVQSGKPEQQQARFRACLPAGVQELSYAADRPGEDWRVREAVARELLATHAGLWFMDHDLFLQENAEPWLEEMDRRLERSGSCLCHPAPQRGPSITNPAFWLSPQRFPPGLPSFARLPLHEEPTATRPYSVRQPATLSLPEKDTLVSVKEYLEPLGMVSGFPLTERDRTAGGPPPFPQHEHLGGLYTFASELPPEPLHGWVRRCVVQFTAFYSTCPPGWLGIEDPVLMQRLEEFRTAVKA